jgi:predicted aspartyl protease
MGLTKVTLSVANPAQPKKAVDADFLVDSGAVYSVVPSSILRQLGVKPHDLGDSPAPRRAAAHRLQHEDNVGLAHTVLDCRGRA